MSSTPPTAAAAPVPPPASGWATGLGVFALVYAILGILVNLGGLAMLGFSKEAQEAAGGLARVQIGLAVTASALGVILLFGAVGLLRRKAWGVRAAGIWVVGRLLLLLVAGVYGWITLPQQVDRQLSLIEQQSSESRGSSGGGSRGVTIRVGGGAGGSGLDREAMLRWSKLAFVGGVVVTGTFPVVCGWILTNSRRREEIAGW